MSHGAYIYTSENETHADIYLELFFRVAGFSASLFSPSVILGNARGESLLFALCRSAGAGFDNRPLFASARYLIFLYIPVWRIHAVVACEVWEEFLVFINNVRGL